MPLVYRAMLIDGGLPHVAPSAASLGVRLPPDKHADIVVDGHGLVEPGTGGMSVSPAWRFLPVHRIPRRLRVKFPRAAGKNDLFIWRMGEGPFTSGPVTERLLLRLDPEKPQKHGLVEPTARMPVADYQQALAQTRGYWRIDEE
jgi:hypothetical protein